MNPYREKLLSLGFQAAPMQKQTTTVVADDGAHRGTVVGTKTEHRDGRVDATVNKVDVQVNPGLVAVREPAGGRSQDG